MPMQKRVLGPIDDRPLPKPGMPESVLAQKDMREKVVDGKKVKVPRVPAFTIETPFAMWWNGLCLNAGVNHVSVERFLKLPLRTRRAVQDHVRDGQFVLQGFSAAKQEFEAEQAQAPKAKPPESAEDKAKRQQAEAAASELGDLEAEAKAEETKAKAKRTRKKTEDPGGLTS